MNRRHQRPRAIRRRVLTHPNRRQHARRLRLRVRRLLLRRRALSISLPARRRRLLRLLLLHLDPLRAEKVRHDIFQRDERGGVLEALRARPPRRPTHSREPRRVRGSDARQRRRRDVKNESHVSSFALAAATIAAPAKSSGGRAARPRAIQTHRRHRARARERRRTDPRTPAADPARNGTRRRVGSRRTPARGEGRRADEGAPPPPPRRRVAPGCGKRPVRRAALGKLCRRARLPAPAPSPPSPSQSPSPRPPPRPTPPRRRVCHAAAVSSAVGRHESAKDSGRRRRGSRRYRNPAAASAPRGFAPAAANSASLAPNAHSREDAGPWRRGTAIARWRDPPGGSRVDRGCAGTTRRRRPASHPLATPRGGLGARDGRVRAATRGALLGGVDERREVGRDGVGAVDGGRERFGAVVAPGASVAG